MSTGLAATTMAALALTGGAPTGGGMAVNEACPQPQLVFVATAPTETSTANPIVPWTRLEPLQLVLRTPAERQAVEETDSLVMGLHAYSDLAELLPGDPEADAVLDTMVARLGLATVEYVEIDLPLE